MAAGVDSARKLLALAAALVAALAWSSTAAQSKTEFKDYLLGPATVVVRVEPDGSLAVRETIEFVFVGTFTGAYRDVPIRKGESIDRISVTDMAPAEPTQTYRPGASAKLGSSGAPSTFGVTRLSASSGTSSPTRSGRSRSATGSADSPWPTTTSWTWT